MYSKGMVYMADLVEDVLLNIIHKIRMDVIIFVAVNRGKITARLQDQVGQSEIIPPANCNERIFEGVD